MLEKLPAVRDLLKERLAVKFDFNHPLFFFLSGGN